MISANIFHIFLRIRMVVNYQNYNIITFYDKYYFNFKYSLKIKYLLPIYYNNIKIILFSYRLTVPSLLSLN